MCDGFLKDCNKALDKLFSLGTEDQQSKARAEGDLIVKNLKVKQPKLFKVEKKGNLIKTQDPKA